MVQHQPRLSCESTRRGHSAVVHRERRLFEFAIWMTLYRAPLTPVLTRAASTANDSRGVANGSAKGTQSRKGSGGQIPSIRSSPSDLKCSHHPCSISSESWNNTIPNEPLMMGPQMANAHPAGEKNLSGRSISSPFFVASLFLLSILPPALTATVLPTQDASVST